jgi:hypothetical protein
MRDSGAGEKGLRESAAIHELDDASTGADDGNARNERRHAWRD